MMKPRFLSAWSTGHMLIAGLAILVTVFITWAAIGTIGETVRAPGQVIARARTQTITVAIDGVVYQLLANEGDHVRKGQLLARLERVQTEAAYSSSLASVAALRAALVRLRAEVLGTPLVFPADVERFPEFVANQKELFIARRRARDEQVTALEQSLALIREQIRVSRPLVEAGDMGRLELVALQGKEVDLVGAIANARNKFFQEAQTDMTKAEEDLATREEELTDRMSLLDRTDIRAPVDGIVRRVDINTPGTRVRPGDVLLELVPTGSYVFEAKLSPADVASIRRGLPASVKLDAFDYSVYGSLDTRVVYISPDALNEKRTDGDLLYYRVQLAVEPAAIKAWNQKRRGTQAIEVQPGMTGTAEIHTGSRTVLSFLTKPLIKTASESMGER